MRLEKAKSENNVRGIWVGVGYVYSNHGIKDEPM